MTMPLPLASDLSACHHGDDEHDSAAALDAGDARRSGPSSNNRKRASKACLACRSRKVRCDVSQRGKPCMNCFLDGESCVVIGRASKRRKPRDHDVVRVNTEATDDSASYQYPGTVVRPVADNSLPNPAERHANDQDGVDSRAPRDGLDASNSHHHPPTQAVPSLSGIGNTDGWARPQPSLHHGTSHFAAKVSSWNVHQDPPEERCAVEGRSDQLQWVGERSMKFGSDITYTFYPFLEINNLTNILPQDVSYLEMQGCFRIPTKPVLDELVKQYFLHVHPIMPLYNEGDFWEMYGAPSGSASEHGRVSLLIFQAMLFSACRYISRSAIRALGFSDMRATRSAFYRRAKASSTVLDLFISSHVANCISILGQLLFDFESESSPIAIAQAALLLSSWIPNSGHSRAYTGNTWIGVAIQQAKLADAHRYASVVPPHWSGNQQASALLKHQNSLKRLWWCIIMYDRVLAVCSRRPIQITRAHFDLDSGRHEPLGYPDLADEIERSRVYNPGTRKSLVEIFELHTKLAVVLTDLLVVVWPLDDAPRWEKRFGDEEMRKIENCKIQMLNWYREASARYPMPKDPGPRIPALESGNRGAADFRHDSVLLYTNLMYMLYHSSMTRLCHHECLQLTLASISPQTADTALSVKDAMAKNRFDIQGAASGAVDCLKEVLRLRLSRWLPLSSTACTSLPLILHIIEAKLSPQANIKLHGLRNLVESVRPDSTDWFYGAIHGIIGLAQLEEPDPMSTITPNELSLSSSGLGGNSNNSSASGDTGAVSSEMGLHLHPSIYLRLALTLDWGMSNSELPNADQLSSCLLRMFATSSVNRIKTMLNEGLTSSRTISRPSPSDVFATETTTASTRPVGAGGERTADDEQQQSHMSGLHEHLRDLDWADQDQAILFGLQLGIISPDMAMEWAEDVVSPESSLPTSDEGGVAAAPPVTYCETAEQEDTVENAKWKEIAGQAFSDTVDIPERNVLDAFIFRDQLPGERAPDNVAAVAGATIKEDGQNAGPGAFQGGGHGHQQRSGSKTGSTSHPAVPAADVGVADMAMATTLLDGLGPVEQEDMLVGDWPR